MKAIDDITALHSFLDLLVHKTGADAALFRCLDMTDLSYPVTLVSNSAIFSKAFFDEYDGGAVSMDPHVSMGLEHRLPPHQVYLCHEHYAETDRAHDPYFQEFLPRHGIRWFAGYLAQSGVAAQSVATGFGLARGPDRSPFPDTLHSLLEPLTPWFEDWTNAFVRAQHNKIISAGFKIALHMGADFLTVIDHQGRNLWADDKALSVLPHLSGLTLRNGVWRAAAKSTGATILDRARETAKKPIAQSPRSSREGPGQNANIYSRHDGRRYAIQCVAVDAETAPHSHEGFRGCAIIGHARAGRLSASKQAKATTPDALEPGAAAPSSPLAALSKKENTVASLVCEGLKNREIADQLGLKTSTVDTHLRRTYRKLGIHSRQQLAALYADSRATLARR